MSEQTTSTNDTSSHQPEIDGRSPDTEHGSAEPSGGNESQTNSTANGHQPDPIDQAAAKAELKQDLQNAQNKEEEQKALKKYKLKIDGEEIEREFTDDQIQRLMQKGMAFDKRGAELHKKAQQIKQFEELVKNNPSEALKMYGLDPDQLAIAQVQQRIEQEMAQEQDPEKADLLRRVQEAEQYKKQMEKTASEKAYEAEKKQYQEKVQKEIISALDTPEGKKLPRTDYTIEKIARYMAHSYRMGYKDVSPADVLDTVYSDIQKDLNSLASGSSAEQLIDILGKDNMKKIR